ncbi:hypothetical protein, partial [Variovorax sp. 67-131]|uniref:hypothetical protein n=1 Tax=Variovorax sp. 67-131 TaxID=1895865 RepID=UPI0025DC8FD8
PKPQLTALCEKQVFAEEDGSLWRGVFPHPARYSERIGRQNLPKVLSNLEELAAAMGSARITVMSIDLGQPLGPLRAWVRSRGFGRHRNSDP